MPDRIGRARPPPSCVFAIAKTRNNKANGEWGSALHESGERIEYFSRLARVFEPVAGVRSFRLITHDIGKPQRA
jgi:hypothetical protein